MPGAKRCPRCCNELPLSDFGFRDSDRTRRQSYCRNCQKAAWRAWYATKANGERHRELVAKRRARRIARHRSIVRAAKAVPCADCGVRYPPYVMDFDHIGPNRAEVSRLVHTEGTDALLAEIKRCEVVCANCHRERTHRRRLEKPKTG